MDQLLRARGMDPPGFASPLRRAAGGAVVAITLWMGVFLSLGQVGMPPVPFQPLPISQLFVLHAMLVLAVLAWYAVGYGGSTAGAPAGSFARQFGLAAHRPLREVAIGLGLGLLTWPLLVAALLLAILLMVAFGGQDLIPQQPPELIVWIAELPVAVKLGVALSAGVVEELFFRGFLQPRVGIGLSTLLFAIAHLSYDQPFMLIGITLLSLFFAGLVAWRQSLWAAIAAHFLFDAVQLLFIIPWALREWSAGGVVAGAAALAGCC